MVLPAVYQMHPYRAKITEMFLTKVGSQVKCLMFDVEVDYRSKCECGVTTARGETGCYEDSVWNPGDRRNAEVNLQVDIRPGNTINVKQLGLQGCFQPGGRHVSELGRRDKHVGLSSYRRLSTYPIP